MLPSRSCAWINFQNPNHLEMKSSSQSFLHGAIPAGHRTVACFSPVSNLTAFSHLLILARVVTSATGPKASQSFSCNVWHIKPTQHYRFSVPFSVLRSYHTLLSLITCVQTHTRRVLKECFPGDWAYSQETPTPFLKIWHGSSTIRIMVVTFEFYGSHH